MEDYVTKYIPKHKNPMNRALHLGGHIYQCIYFPPDAIIYNISMSYLVSILQKNNSFDDLLEIIPKEVYETPENIFFMNQKTFLGDSIFKIVPENLIDNKLIYYIVNKTMI